MCGNSATIKTFIRQCKALLRKNYLLQRRQCLLFIMVFILGLIVSFTLLYNITTDITSRDAEPFRGDESIVDASPMLTERIILVTPETQEVRNIVNNLVIILQRMSNFSVTPRFEFHADSNSMEEAFLKDSMKINIGIVFDYQGGSNYTYAIRVPYDDIPDTRSWYQDGWRCGYFTAQKFHEHCDGKQYIYSGFNLLQVAIDTAILRVETGDSAYPVSRVHFQTKSKIPYLSLPIVGTIIQVILIVVLAPFYVMLVLSLIREIDNEKKIKNTMKIMGLRDSAFWFSYGFTCFLVLAPVTMLYQFALICFKDVAMSISIKYLDIWMLLGPPMIPLSCVAYFCMHESFGAKQKPWYYLTTSSWYSRKVDNHQRLSQYDCGEDIVESLSSQIADNLAVRILDIHKEFPSDGPDRVVPTLDGLSLEIYENQITALLGNNGAGKTTLVNIMTGLILPTKGTASIYGLDITNKKDMQNIRTMTGLCPQQNTLYDDLSCKEHLKLLAGIKGVPENMVQSEIAIALKNVDLVQEKETYVKNLSGGQKRKLSVAIALIGNPKIIFLDEPTAGMDPHSRRKIWRLLQEKKEGRVILMTTHFMDEAEILADRIAIISKGKLRCCGSPLFLKNEFGVGYHLNMQVERGSNIDNVTEIVTKWVPGGKVQKAHGKELVYTLPQEEVSNFADLFFALDRPHSSVFTIAETLGITRYGVSMTSLEEVFLKLEEDDKPKSKPSIENNDVLHTPPNDDGDDVSSFMTMETTMATSHLIETDLKSQQFWAFFKIQYKMSIRNWLRNILTVLIPAVLVFLRTMLDVYVVSPIEDTTPLGLYLKNAVTEYARPTGGSAEIPPLVVNDSATHLGYSVLYNDSAIHSLPVVINLMSNVLLKKMNISSVLSVVNLPWPKLSAVESYKQLFSPSVLAAFAFFSMLAFHDIGKKSKIQKQMKVSGMKTRIGWATKFFIDILGESILVVIILITALISQFPKRPLAGDVVCRLLLAIVYLPCNTMLRYVIYKYRLPVWIVSLISYQVVMYTDFSYEDIALYIHYFFCVAFPPYTIYGGLFYIDRKYRLRTDDPRVNSLDIPIAEFFSREIIVTILMPLVYCVLIFIYNKTMGSAENGFYTHLCLSDEREFSRMIPDQNEEPIEEDGNEDEDITREKKRVAYIKSSNSPAAGFVQNLRKEFVKKTKSSRKYKKKVAVKNATFAVETAEIFGLLGPNGSGKSTTIKMMIGETKPTRGQVMTGGYDIPSCKLDCFKTIGYCPQQDALWDSITLKEHIEFYAKIRGVPKSEIPAVLDYFIDIMKLDEHKNKIVEKLSGGTKRKLSFILSILGGSEIILLDEPSTGMDPQSKRLLWDTLTDSINIDRGAILTTHDMEEADALCLKIAIMVDGKIQCLGSPQYLKNKYGKSYLLEAKLKAESGAEASPSRMEVLNEHIISLFPEASCLEKSAERVQYRVPKEGFRSLGHVFSALEKAKTTHSIETYSFSQTSLEQVFLQFVRQQMDKDNEDLEDHTMQHV